MAETELCLAALEMLVEFKISGLPVVDDDERVVRGRNRALLSSPLICVIAARSRHVSFWPLASSSVSQPASATQGRRCASQQVKWCSAICVSRSLRPAGGRGVGLRPAVAGGRAGEDGGAAHRALAVCLAFPVCLAACCMLCITHSLHALVMLRPGLV